MERKDKYMPLSETMSPSIVTRYDGTHIYTHGEVQYTLGNYLGAGVAGIVYEAYALGSSTSVAIKLLHPIGYKVRSSLKGLPLVIPGRTTSPGSLPNCKTQIAWFYTRAEWIAGYADNKSIFREVPLDICVKIWGWEAEEMDEDPIFETAIEKNSVQIEGRTVPLPTRPTKFISFLKSRQSIYREIAHMHKLTGNGKVGYNPSGGHCNVLKLYTVLELTEKSKTTIFLVLELAMGGELFERIRPGKEVVESTARVYMKQLFSGVLYCHQLGIVHRDLKPENLLLSDVDGGVLKIADFGLSAHFIAAVSGHENGVVGSSSSHRAQVDVNNSPFPSPFRRLKSVVGSPYYVAPEVLSTDRFGYDGRKADMWSIGIILYGLLVGTLPFGKELHSCPRYSKFCEWVRSLPHAVLSGKGPTARSFFESGKPKAIFNTMNNEASRVFNSNETGRVLDISTSAGTDDRSKLFLKMNTSLTIEYPAWFFPSSMSIEARMILSALLHPEPSKRVSCEDAYRHSWITKERL